MPSVVQTSIPMPRTSRTIVRMRSKPLLRPARSLHAAPMQKRVLPFSLACRAAARTGSMSTSFDAFVDVLCLEDCEQYEPCSAHSDEYGAHSEKHRVTHSPHCNRQL